MTRALLVLLVVGGVLAGCSSSAKTSSTKTTAFATETTPAQRIEKKFCADVKALATATNADYLRLKKEVQGTYIADMLNTLQHPDPGAAGITERKAALNNIVTQCKRLLSG